MALSKEQYDKYVEELGNEKTSQGRKVVIVGEMRNDYNSMAETHEKTEKEYNRLKTDQDMLINKNLELFKQTSYGYNGEEKPKEKSYSESITLEAIEKANRVY